MAVIVLHINIFSMLAKYHLTSLKWVSHSIVSFLFNQALCLSSHTILEHFIFRLSRPKMKSYYVLPLWKNQLVC